MARFTKLIYDDLDPPARALADRVMSRSSDGIGGPFNMLLKSPGLGQRVVDLLDYFNEGETLLPTRCRRLAVLMLARAACARYAWWSHSTKALNNGELTAEQIAALNRQEPPGGLDAETAATHAYVRALIDGSPTPSDTLAQIKSVFDEAVIVDLIVLCGTYKTVATLLNEADVGLPEGAEDSLDR